MAGLDYELGRLLGRGGMGEVYHAVHRRSGRPVALKVGLPGAPVDALRREALAFARLRHPHVLPVLDVGRWDGDEESRLYLALPFEPGGSAESSPPRTWEEARHLLAQLLRALGHAHAQGILHRDVKPANLLRRGEHWLLADFGLALIRGAGPRGGTPGWTAPEQLRRGAAQGPGTDLWAVGRLAAWLGASLVAPSGLTRWVDKLSADRLADRPASAAEALASLPGEGPPPASMGEAPPPGGLPGVGLGLLPLLALPVVGRREALEGLWTRRLEERWGLVALTGPSGVGRRTLARAHLARAAELMGDLVWEAGQGADLRRLLEWKGLWEAAGPAGRLVAALARWEVEPDELFAALRGERDPAHQQAWAVALECLTEAARLGVVLPQEDAFTLGALRLALARGARMLVLARAEDLDGRARKEAFPLAVPPTTLVERRELHFGWLHLHPSFSAALEDRYGEDLGGQIAEIQERAANASLIAAPGGVRAAPGEETLRLDLSAERRAQGVPAPARAQLMGVAVVAGPCPLEHLDRLAAHLGVPPAAGALEQLGLLRRTPGGLVVCPPELGEGLAQLPGASAAHRAWLAVRGLLLPPARRVRHLRGAGRPDDALAEALLAAETLYRRADVGQGEHLLEGVADLVPTAPVEVRARFGLWRAVFSRHRGQLSTALGAVEEALDLPVADADLRAELAAERAMIDLWRGDARAAWDRVAAWLGAPLGPVARVQLLDLAAGAAEALGRREEAWAHAETGLSLARASGQVRPRAFLLRKVVRYTAERGALTEALVREADELVRSGLDAQASAHLMNDLGVYALRAGRHREAWSRLRKARRWFRRAGDPLVSLVAVNLAVLELAQERPAEARLLLEEDPPDRDASWPGLPLAWDLTLLHEHLMRGDLPAAEQVWARVRPQAGAAPEVAAEGRERLLAWAKLPRSWRTRLEAWFVPPAR